MTKRQIINFHIPIFNFLLSLSFSPFHFVHTSFPTSFPYQGVTSYRRSKGRRYQWPLQWIDSARENDRKREGTDGKKRQLTADQCGSSGCVSFFPVPSYLFLILLPFYQHLAATSFFSLGKWRVMLGKGEEWEEETTTGGPNEYNSKLGHQ